MVFCKRIEPNVMPTGICFGHQIVGLALGGTCVPNNGIWEVGPSNVNLSEVGKKVFGMRKEILVCSLALFDSTWVTSLSCFLSTILYNDLALTAIVEHPTVPQRSCPNSSDRAFPFSMSRLNRPVRESRNGTVL
jgi:anthranilate/para-aminobenzoate synthase component II